MPQENFPKWPEFFEDDFKVTEEILRSGKVNYWTGNEGKSFEKEFAEYFQSRFAVALSNGSLALTSAYRALDLEPGDEIITTPRTFIATTSCAVLLGAVPVFADVDNESGCINSKNIEPLINNKTKLISVVHLGGWPAEMESICDLAKSYGIEVVEDCSQAHGAKINNKSVGTFGKIGTWSFCQEKIMTTGGEGGMITTSDKEIWEKIWSLKDHGKSREAVFNKKHPSGFKWLHESIGNNYRMTEIQSAIGRNQLQRLDEWNRIREINAMILYEILNKISCISIPLPPNGYKHAWYKFYSYLIPESLKEDWDRDRIIFEINSLGFPAFSGSCSEIYLEKCLQEKNLFPKKRLPVAKKLGETSLMFLIHPNINTENMRKYANIIKSVLKQAMK